MKKVGVFANIDKDSDFSLTNMVIENLKERNSEIVFCESISFENADEKTGLDLPEVDFAIVLGGDGTILRVAKLTALKDIPVLGINNGNLGYLADVEKDDYSEALDKVFKGNFTIENRMMLEAVIDFESNKPLSYALNEVCLSNSSAARMISFSLSINNDYIDTYNADGIIVSTPTGSTAYNLSAGGPILKPDTELIALTPVCPHALNSRPFVISGKDYVCLEAKDCHGNITLSIDGQRMSGLEDGQSVIIKRAEICAKIIKTTNLNFYDIIRRKMMGR